MRANCVRVQEPAQVHTCSRSVLSGQALDEPCTFVDVFLGG